MCITIKTKLKTWKPPARFCGFRLQQSLLRKLFKPKRNNIVIALGGGTIGNIRNLEIIKETGVSIYLKVSPKILYKRLKNKIDRPLFKDLVLGEKNEEEFVKRINELLEKRESNYKQADLEINTDETRVGYTVDKIAKQKGGGGRPQHTIGGGGQGFQARRETGRDGDPCEKRLSRRDEP